MGEGLLQSVATSRQSTHRGRHPARWAVGLALAVAALAFAGLAVAASSYSDAQGDNNEAPDLRTVTLAEAPDGTVSIAVAVGNFQTLPENSWINLWFDLDSNASTGDEGDETLIRFLSDGTLEFYRWNGSDLVAQPTTGMSASFSAGALTVMAPKAAFDDATAFGVLAVAARSQELGDSEFIAADYAPDTGRSAYSGPAEAAFTDAAGDHDGAPDIASVRASDARDGWISIAVTTPNYAELPDDTALLISIDRDNHPSTGDSGAEVLLTASGGQVSLQRWDSKTKSWVDDAAPTRARVRNSGNVFTVEVHESELDNTPRFGFAVVSLDLNLDAEVVRGVDFAPDDGLFYQYTLANKPALLLTATKLFATPSRPTAGRHFTVNLGVRRSDTSKGITSGTVDCKVLVKNRRVPAKGSVAGGGAHCALVVPPRTSHALLRGTITAHSGGKSVSQHFTYVIR